MNIFLNLTYKSRLISYFAFILASIYILSPSVSIAQFSPEERNNQRSKIDTSIDDQLIADSSTVNESELPALASANQKYSNLIQVLNCPGDRSNYGDFNDYGYGDDDSWCGQESKAGYRVWVYPNWYVWQNVANDQAEKIPALATANGKYSKLIQVLNCPGDRSSYGEFDDWGYWDGGSWCEQTGKAGYWVWVAPNWYIWQKQN